MARLRVAVKALQISVALCRISFISVYIFFLLLVPVSLSKCKSSLSDLTHSRTVVLAYTALCRLLHHALLIPGVALAFSSITAAWPHIEACRNAWPGMFPQRLRDSYMGVG